MVFLLSALSILVSKIVNADNEDDFLKRKPMFSPVIAICSDEAD